MVHPVVSSLTGFVPSVMAHRNVMRSAGSTVVLSALVGAQSSIRDTLRRVAAALAPGWYRARYLRALAKVAVGCDLASAIILNYGRNPAALVIEKGVKILGEVEVFERGRLSIGEFTFIGHAKIFCAREVHIGRGCWIADHVFIMDSDLHPASPQARAASAKQYAEGSGLEHYTGVLSGPIEIEDAVWIGVNVIVLPGVRIGRGSIVGAGSVVTSAIPPFSIVAGNPARIVGNVKNDLDDATASAPAANGTIG